MGNRFPDLQSPEQSHRPKTSAIDLTIKVEKYMMIVRKKIFRVLTVTLTHHSILDSL